MGRDHGARAMGQTMGPDHVARAMDRAMGRTMGPLGVSHALASYRCRYNASITSSSDVLTTLSGDISEAFDPNQFITSRSSTSSSFHLGGL